MMTWLTRMSFLETARDLETPLLAQGVKETSELTHALLLGDTNGLENHPLVRMWNGYEVALAGYSAALNLELATRGVLDTTHLRLTQLVRNLRNNEDAPFMPPTWLEDTDILRSHRSNMVRRWPDDYKSTWKGTPELMPYLWPFVDENGSYEIMVSKEDKKLLASGERKLSPAIKKRVFNL